MVDRYAAAKGVLALWPGTPTAATQYLSADELRELITAAQQAIEIIDAAAK